MRSLHPTFFPPSAMAVVAVTMATCVAGHAQTCADPLPLVPDNPTWASTCGAQGFVTGGLAGPGAVLSFNLDHSASVYFTLSGTPAFEPQVCVTDAEGECGTGPCLATGDASNPALLDGLPSGSYRAIVTATPFSAPGACGGFGIIESVAPDETIVANGFD